MAAARVRPSVAILGCGAVGGAFAWRLAEVWKEVGLRGELWLWSRAESVRRLRRELARYSARTRVLLEPEEALEAGTAVLLCLPDEAIMPMARQLARAVPRASPSHPPVLHTNGFLGAEALVALSRKGVAVGKLHPFLALNRNSTFVGDECFGIEGDPRALRAARAIVRWLGGHALPLRRGTGPDYHAAASLLSGGLVALYALAERVLAHSIPSAAARRRALDELVRSTQMNIWFNGSRTALTGAIARGAEGIVRGHLQALRRAPDALEAYRVLGRTMLELARERGSIDGKMHRRIAEWIGVRARRR